MYTISTYAYNYRLNISHSVHSLDPTRISANTLYRGMYFRRYNLYLKSMKLELKANTRNI